MRIFLKSKIHRAKVTDANPDYMGSITIDFVLMEKVGLEEFEKVAVWNITNGERIETYTVKGQAQSGVICLNGAAAKKFSVGDLIIIAAFEVTDTPTKPKIILVDENNKFTQFLET